MAPDGWSCAKYTDLRGLLDDRAAGRDHGYMRARGDNCAHHDADESAFGLAVHVEPVAAMPTKSIGTDLPWFGVIAFSPGADNRLVALTSSRDLSVHAKDLFIAAMKGKGPSH
jgi:hypothetical protein